MGMKALELTVHEIDSTDPSMAVVDGFWEYRPYDPAKRLTDAELAAEYHAWDAHLKHLQWCELSSGDELGRESWRKLNARLETLWWFTNLPHYDEAP